MRITFVLRRGLITSKAFRSSRLSVFAALAVKFSLPYQFAILKKISLSYLYRKKFDCLENLNNVNSNQEIICRPCATCFRVRSPSLEISPFRIDNGENYCDCETSDIMEERAKRSFNSSNQRYNSEEPTFRRASINETRCSLNCSKEFRTLNEDIADVSMRKTASFAFDNGLRRLSGKLLIILLI